MGNAGILQGFSQGFTANGGLGAKMDMFARRDERRDRQKVEQQKAKVDAAKQKQAEKDKREAQKMKELGVHTKLFAANTTPASVKIASYNKIADFTNTPHINDLKELTPEKIKIVEAMDKIHEAVSGGKMQPYEAKKLLIGHQSDLRQLTGDDDSEDPRIIANNASVATNLQAEINEGVRAITAGMQGQAGGKEAQTLAKIKEKYSNDPERGNQVMNGIIKALKKEKIPEQDEAQPFLAAMSKVEKLLSNPDAFKRMAEARGITEDQLRTQLVGELHSKFGKSASEIKSRLRLGFGELFNKSVEFQRTHGL